MTCRQNTNLVEPGGVSPMALTWGQSPERHGASRRSLTWKYTGG